MARKGTEGVGTTEEHFHERMALFLNDHFGDRAKKFPLMALIQKMSCALKSVRGTELEDNEHKERIG